MYVLSRCIVKVHGVCGKGRHYSEFTMYASVADCTQIIGRVALNFDSDKFQSFNHREELDSTVQLPNFRWHAAHGVCYI